MVLFTCLGLIVMDGTGSQTAFAVLITIVFAVVAFKLQPFVEDKEDATYGLSQWSLFALTFYGLLQRTNVLANDGYNATALGALLTLFQVCRTGKSRHVGWVISAPLCFPLCAFPWELVEQMLPILQSSRQCIMVRGT